MRIFHACATSFLKLYVGDYLIIKGAKTNLKIVDTRPLYLIPYLTKSGVDFHRLALQRVKVNFKACHYDAISVKDDFLFLRVKVRFKTAFKQNSCWKLKKNLQTI